MTPLLYALTALATLAGLCLSVLGAMGGCVAVVVFDDPLAKKAGVVIACLGFALFIATVAQLPALVLV